MSDENIDVRKPQLYGGIAPTNVSKILYDVVVGTEIVLWFETEMGPIGLHLWSDTAIALRKRLDDLILNIE